MLVPGLAFTPQGARLGFLALVSVSLGVLNLLPLPVLERSALGVGPPLLDQAVDQLRRAIYALHQPQRDVVHSLPELLLEVAEHHRPHLAVGVRVDGAVAELTADADHEIARAVGEALFNVATHAEATRAAILTAERTALNILQRLSGIATKTARMMNMVEGTGATIVDTRKSLEGPFSVWMHAPDHSPNGQREDIR